MEARKNPTNDFTGFVLMNPQLLNETELPLTYYKKDTLFSNQAKTSIVLPDLKQLPSILPSSSSANNRVEKTVKQPVDELEDDEFLKQFESCTLTNWSHKTHLRMAWLYLTHDGRRVGVNKTVETKAAATGAKFALTVGLFMLCKFIFISICFI